MTDYITILLPTGMPLSVEPEVAEVLKLTNNQSVSEKEALQIIYLNAHIAIAKIEEEKRKDKIKMSDERKIPVVIKGPGVDWFKEQLVEQNNPPDPQSESDIVQIIRASLKKKQPKK